MNQQFKVKFYSKPENNDDFSHFSSRGTDPENWYQQQFKNIYSRVGILLHQRPFHLVKPKLLISLISFDLGNSY